MANKNFWLSGLDIWGRYISRARVVVKNEVIDQVIGFRLVMDEDLTPNNKLAISQ